MLLAFRHHQRDIMRVSTMMALRSGPTIRARLPNRWR